MLALLVAIIVLLLFLGLLWAFFVLPRRLEMRRINRELTRYRVGRRYAYESEELRCSFRVTAVEPGSVNWRGDVTRTPRLMAQIDQAKQAVCISFFEVCESGALRGGCDYDPGCEGGSLREMEE